MENIRAMQVYEAVAKVAGDLFADPKKRGDSRPTFNQEDVPMNAEDAKRKFAEIFGGI